MNKTNNKTIRKAVVALSLLFSIAGLQGQTYRKEATLAVQQVYDSDDSGIIGTVTSGGKITASMYEYSAIAPDNKGLLLYEVYIDATTTDFTGKPYLIKHENLQGLAPYIFGDWPSNLSKVSVMALQNRNNKLANGTLSPLFQVMQKVVLEVVIDNASLLQVKFPGFSPIDITFFGDHFENVLKAIRNPLSYPDYTIVAAHRGYWKDFPENSLPAYDLTVLSGADMVELDTRLTKDDTLVAFHDACLDRITTGTGKLRDYTWNQVKDLYLRDRFGNPTKYHIVTVREALQYLKGRALVNLDIKEQIITDPKTKTVVSDLLSPTFKAALRIAKETGTLNQLVIKGKFRADELQELLEDEGISLNDFIYTPVAFGWDTKDVGQYVNEWLQENIHGIELTYKVAYDPILAYMPKVSNKNIRIGNYTMWPEDSIGVMAEDFINDPARYCQMNYREYNFLNESYYGELPASSSEKDAGGSGPPVLPDDRDYGGGSYDYINQKLKTKTARPLGSNDGRGDWDWLIRQGADFVITDRPVLMVQYLEALGKRKLEVPVITEISLPDCPVVQNGSGGTRRITDLRGMVRKIKDYNLVEFFTPDTREIPIDTTLVIDQYKQYSNGKTKQWVRNFIKTNGRICNCNDIFKDSVDIAPIRRFPLHSLPEWSQLYPGFDLYINANWFDVREPWPINPLIPKERKGLPKAMYKEPCTNIFGWLQAMKDPGQSSGIVLTENDPDQPGYQDYDAFVITKKGKALLVPKDNVISVLSNKDDPSILATGGYIIAKNGQPVPYAELPLGTNKTVTKKRSLIGFNGNEMYVAEFQSPMLEPYQAAYLMVNYFNCKDVFMYDAGGSTTMLSSRGNFPKVRAESGPYITSGSAPEDKNLDDERVYRPVPNFLAIRLKQ